MACLFMRSALRTGPILFSFSRRLGGRPTIKLKDWGTKWRARRWSCMKKKRLMGSKKKLAVADIFGDLNVLNLRSMLFIMKICFTCKPVGLWSLWGLCPWMCKALFFKLQIDFRTASKNLHPLLLLLDWTGYGKVCNWWLHWGYCCSFLLLVFWGEWVRSLLLLPGDRTCLLFHQWWRRIFVLAS